LRRGERKEKKNGMVNMNFEERREKRKKKRYQ
jgi:hypothetical protein